MRAELHARHAAWAEEGAARRSVAGDAFDAQPDCAASPITHTHVVCVGVSDHLATIADQLARLLWQTQGRGVIRDGCGYSAPFHAVHHGNVAMLRFLCTEGGADPAHRLAAAVVEALQKAAAALLVRAAPALVSAADDAAMTAADHAAERGHGHVSAMLDAHRPFTIHHLWDDAPRRAADGSPTAATADEWDSWDSVSGCRRL
eukprot:gene11706-24050_t